MKRSFETASAGVQRKRQKIRSARSIASESASNSVKTGNVPIQEFLASRKFEIKALSDSIQKSREAGVQRAFQSLPRYLRRRAASHNVKRVPRRLRARAQSELTEDDKKTQQKRIPFKRKRGRRGTMQRLARLQEKLTTKTKEGVPEPPLIPQTELPAVKAMEKGRFVDRQRNKTWLPSHLWTCKRAKMLTKWNYAIPISPNEKTYRSTHRASTSKGAIIFDTSYNGTILLKGSAESVSLILGNITGSKQACGLRAQKGQRAISCHVLAAELVICPATVLWCSASTTATASAMLRIHPAAYVEVWKLVLEHRKKLKLSDKVKVIDMRFQLGSIDIIGPQAINASLSVLKVSETNDCSKAFKSLHGMSPNEIPRDIVMPLLVGDPRKVFPPRMITEKPKSQNEYLTTWPDHKIESALFSREKVHASNTSKPKATCLGITSDCPSVPVIVIHTTLGLSLLAPWSYITDFWYSLNHLPLVRFGGLLELSQIHYEHSIPSFPKDYPGTSTWDLNASEERTELEKHYLRRPPAKRISFPKSVNGKPELGDPFLCDFKYLLNHHHHHHTTNSDLDISHVSASILDHRNSDSTVDITMEDVSVQPLFTSTPLLPGPPAKPESLPKSIPKQTMSQDPPVSIVDTSSTKNIRQEQQQQQQPLLILASQLMSVSQSQSERGIIQVRLRLSQRGCPTSRARIYHSTASGKPGTLIGFVTTGNFSLAEGRATGIGSLAVTHVKKALVKAQEKKWRDVRGNCFVRDVGTGNFRQAQWELLHKI